MTLVLISFCSFFSLHLACDYSISSRVAIIALSLIVLTNCQRLAKSYSHGEQINVEGVAMGNKLMLKALPWGQINVEGVAMGTN